MAVVLILVGGLAIAGERSLEASRESSAAQSVQSFQADETVFQRSYGGFSNLAANLQINTGGVASCTSDGEMPSQLANGYDTGIVQGGYTLKYVSSSTFNGSACGGSGGQTPAVVATTYEFVANPIDLKTKSFCADSSGVFYLPAPAVMANAGAGCLVDNGASIPVGQ
jgi:hypothetical protein